MIQYTQLTKSPAQVQELKRFSDIMGTLPTARQKDSYKEIKTRYTWVVQKVHGGLAARPPGLYILVRSFADYFLNAYFASRLPPDFTTSLSVVNFFSILRILRCETFSSADNSAVVTKSWFVMYSNIR